MFRLTYLILDEVTWWSTAERLLGMTFSKMVMSDSWIPDISTLVFPEIEVMRDFALVILPSLATDASADCLIAPPMSSAGPFPWPAFRKFRDVKWVNLKFAHVEKKGCKNLKLSKTTTHCCHGKLSQCEGYSERFVSLCCICSFQKSQCGLHLQNPNPLDST